MVWGGGGCVEGVIVGMGVSKEELDKSAACANESQLNGIGDTHGSALGFHQWKCQ
jgi:hypothetical protein